MNLERTLDKQREKIGVVRRRPLKRSSLSEAMTKKGRQDVFYYIHTQEVIYWLSVGTESGDFE